MAWKFRSLGIRAGRLLPIRSSARSGIWVTSLPLGTSRSVTRESGLRRRSTRRGDVEIRLLGRDAVTSEGVPNTRLQSGGGSDVGLPGSRSTKSSLRHAAAEQVRRAGGILVI